MHGTKKYKQALYNCGNIYELKEITEIARQNNLLILADEIYDRLVMDELEHISIASLAPDLFCVIFSGLSKSHMVAGFRVGWMILSGNKEIARELSLSEGTVRNSISNILFKLGLRDRTQLAIWAVQTGVVNQLP